MTHWTGLLMRADDSGAATVNALPFDEAFAYASFAAFMAAYSGNVDTWAVPFNPGDPVPPEIELTNGALTMHGSANQVSISFGPEGFPSTREWWCKLSVTVAGGAYDGDLIPVSASIFGAGDGQAVIDDRSQLFALTTVGSDGQTTTNTAVSELLAVGAHTLILCGSEPAPTSFTGELWIDKTAGAAADASHTQTKGAGDGVNTLLLTVSAPKTVGRSLAITRARFVAASRAADPFGIL